MISLRIIIILRVWFLNTELKTNEFQALKHKNDKEIGRNREFLNSSINQGEKCSEAESIKIIIQVNRLTR